MTFSQSNIKCQRTFKSWRYELTKKFNKVPNDRTLLERYYWGGYSPKMVICELLNIPFYGN